MRRFAMVLMLLLIPSFLLAQAKGPKKSLRATMAAADSLVDSSNFHVEFGSDLRATQTGDSLPADVRLGVIVGKNFTIEGAVAAQQDSGYTEADVALGFTGAIFPGATNFHGQYVHAAGVLHYEGAAYQYGIRFGTGNRQVASTTAGALARISAGMIHFFDRGLLKAHNVAYVEVGLSFLK